MVSNPKNALNTPALEGRVGVEQVDARFSRSVAVCQIAAHKYDQYSDVSNADTKDLSARFAFVTRATPIVKAMVV
jgi:hypothetical protein